MCDKCVSARAENDQAYAAHRNCVVEGARWARKSLEAGYDPTEVWMEMGRSIINDSVCGRADLAMLLAACYVQSASEDYFQ